MREDISTSLWLTEFRAQQPHHDSERSAEWQRALGETHGRLIDEQRRLNAGPRHPGGYHDITVGSDGVSQMFRAEGGWAMVAFDLPWEHWSQSLIWLTCAIPLHGDDEQRRALGAQLARVDGSFSLSVRSLKQTVETIWASGLSVLWDWSQQQISVRAEGQALQAIYATASRRNHGLGWTNGQRWLTLATQPIEVAGRLLSEHLGTEASHLVLPRLARGVHVAYERS